MYKNSTVAETVLLHLQLFMISHFHFLIIVELVTSKVLLQQPEQMFCHKV
jgi:hypothetical protein